MCDDEMVVDDLKGENVVVSPSTAGDDGSATDQKVLECPICLEIPTEVSIALNCGHKLCFSCAKQWLQINSLCPICQTKVDSSVILEKEKEKEKQEETQLHCIYECCQEKFETRELANEHETKCTCRPQPGDDIYFDGVLNIPLFEHHAVCVVDGILVHVWGYSKDNFFDSDEAAANSRIEMITLEEFRKLAQQHNSRIRTMKYIKSDNPSVVAMRAREKVGQPYRFNGFRRSSGHFVCYCKTGTEKSEQVHKMVGGAVGSAVGVIGGPLGMLVGGAVGSLVGYWVFHNKN